MNDLSHNQSHAEEVVSQIKDLGRKSTLAIGDVSRRTDVKNIIGISVKELGPLDTMVANAGIAQVKPLLELTDDDFRRMFEVNVHGVFYSYTEAAKQMIKQGSGGKLIGCARCDPSLETYIYSLMLYAASSRSSPLPCYPTTLPPSGPSAV